MHQNVWLGTLGGGVNFVKFNDNKSTGNAKTNDYNSKMTITFINKEEGLCNENVPGILEDNYGYLWFSTFDGLARYQPYTKTFQTFISSDGISNNEFNYASAFKDSKGNLWFGGLNGINKIDPGQTIASKQTASLELISFTKYNRNSNLQERRFISDNDQPQVYEISPYDSWFQFNWTLPNYINNQKNNYYIKLEGLNDIWQYNGNLAFIRYHNLTPGDYTLHIKGADSKGNWSPDEISIKIIVNPIFYQTWWFRFLIFSIAGCIVYYVYKYNLNKKLEMERMRVRIASDLHDEVGSMLSGLAMQSELLQLDNNTSSQSKLENIANISRNVIGKMRDLVWSIDSRRDTVQDLIDRMQDAVSEVLQERDIAYLFEVGELPMQKELPIIVRQQLFLIFNEAITNIVRHSDATIVNLKIGNYSENFILTVFDNGSKNPNGHKISGLGLDNMRMRAQKIGAKFSIDTKDGYKVTITMAKL
jgi:two-component sensor histidine kinase